MAAMQPAPAQHLYPARFFMRPFRFDLGGGLIPFVAGGANVTVPLRKQGYLDMLVVHLTAAYTVATAALIFVELGAYNCVQTFNLSVPNKPQPPVNAGGFFMHVWNLRNRDFNPKAQQWRFPAQGTLDANAYWAGLVDAFPVALGAETLTLWWVLPTHYSVDDIRGTVPLGNQEQVNLIVTPAALADYLAVAGNFTLATWTLDVEQVWLAPPPPGAPIMPTTSMPNADGVDTDWIVAYDETYQAIVAAGLNLVNITPNYTILGMAHATTYATASVIAQKDMASITGLQLVLNSQQLFPDGPIAAALFAMHTVYENDVPLPLGVWMYDRDVLGRADWIYTDSLTEIQSQIVISATAVAGTNPRIYTSTRRLIDLNPAAHLLAAG
jgi:hypothetical protein